MKIYKYIPCGKEGTKFLRSIVKHKLLKITYPTISEYESNDDLEFPIGPLPTTQYDNLWRNEVLRKSKEHGIGFISFAGENHDKGLMWNRYTNDGNGIKIEFDINENGLNTKNLILFDHVKYLETNELFGDFNGQKWNTEPNYREKVIKEAIWKKHKRWEYEDEWRLQVQADKIFIEGINTF